MSYERKQYEPLDKEEWERRTRENVEACDAIATKYGGKLLTIEERIDVGRMVARLMKQEKEFRLTSSAGSERCSHKAEVPGSIPG